MKTGILGLGHSGSVSAVCFARAAKARTKVIKKLKKSYKIIDLVGVNDKETILMGEGSYEGICW